MDLGHKLNLGEPVTAGEKTEPKIIYPNATINDEAAENFCKENDCEVGNEYAITGKIKITAKREDRVGHSVSFDLLELDDVTEERNEGGEPEDKAGKEPEDKAGKEPEDKAGKEPEKKAGKEPEKKSEEDDGEEKILGYKRPRKSAATETPDIGAGFLD